MGRGEGSAVASSSLLYGQAGPRQAGKPSQLKLNEERADRGLEALYYFSGFMDDPLSDIADGLADLNHFCDAKKIDWDEVVERAAVRFEDSLSFDSPPPVFKFKQEEEEKFKGATYYTENTAELEKMPMRERRVHCATQALKSVYGDPNSFSNVVTAVADLHHLGYRYGTNWDATVEKAGRYYNSDQQDDQTEAL